MQKGRHMQGHNPTNAMTRHASHALPPGAVITDVDTLCRQLGHTMGVGVRPNAT